MQTTFLDIIINLKFSMNYTKNISFVKRTIKNHEKLEIIKRMLFYRQFSPVFPKFFLFKTMLFTS